MPRRRGLRPPAASQGESTVTTPAVATPPSTSAFDPVPRVARSLRSYRAGALLPAELWIYLIDALLRADVRQSLDALPAELREPLREFCRDHPPASFPDLFGGPLRSRMQQIHQWCEGS